MMDTNERDRALADNLWEYVRTNSTITHDEFLRRITRHLAAERAEQAAVVTEQEAEIANLHDDIDDVRFNYEQAGEALKRETIANARQAATIARLTAERDALREALADIEHGDDTAPETMRGTAKRALAGKEAERE